MRNALRLLLVSAVLATPWACTSGKDETSAYDPNDVACTCGQPVTDLEGCPHPLCMRGEGKPDNPDCVCGSIFSIEEGR